MHRYKVTYEKFAYVYADSEEEAIELAADGCTVYEEEEPMTVEDCGELED